MQKAQATYSVILFFLAALMEVAGCYMIRETARGDRPLWMGVSGGLMPVAYGLIATQQPAGFGRTYAAYGGVFIVMSLLWAWVVGKIRPDQFELLGTLIVVAGTAILFFAPGK